MYNSIISLEDFYKTKNNHLGVLYYFSTLNCSVGEALEPKVIDLLEKEFSKIPFYFVNMNLVPDVAAVNSVFVEPTILVFFEGKETIRKSRIISISDLYKSIQRIYKIAFR